MIDYAENRFCAFIGRTYIIKINEAVEDNKPLIEKVVTISGEGIKNPKNLRIKIGTKFSFLLEHCGGYIDNLEEALVKDLIIKNNIVKGVILENDKQIKSNAVILTTGTYLSPPPTETLKHIKYFMSKSLTYIIHVFKI